MSQSHRASDWISSELQPFANRLAQNREGVTPELCQKMCKKLRRACPRYRKIHRRGRQCSKEIARRVQKAVDIHTFTHAIFPLTKKDYEVEQDDNVAEFQTCDYIADRAREAIDEEVPKLQRDITRHTGGVMPPTVEDIDYVPMDEGTEDDDEFDEEEEEEEESALQLQLPMKRQRGPGSAQPPAKRRKRD